MVWVVFIALLAFIQCCQIASMSVVLGVSVFSLNQSWLLTLI